MSVDLLRTKRTIDVDSRCFVHSLISVTVVLPIAATKRIQSICGRIDMTSSPTNIGGKSTITVQALKSRLISCRMAVIDRDAIHSDEFIVEASQGRTENFSLLMLTWIIAFDNFSFPSSTLPKPRSHLN